MHSAPSLEAHRYTVIPRTLSFLSHGADVLLLRLPDDHPDWPRQMNGVGGHIEPGEDAASAARREIEEEVGLRVAHLQLRGSVLIDTGGRPGIALYVFTGQAQDSAITPSSAGEARWVPRARVHDQALVPDLHILLPRVFEAEDGAPPFNALYRRDADGRMEITFEGAQETPA